MIEDIKTCIKEHKRELVIGGMSATFVMLLGRTVWNDGYIKGFNAGKKRSSQEFVTKFIGRMEQALMDNDLELYKKTMDVLEDSHVVRKVVKE